MLIGAHGGVLGEVKVSAEDRATIPMAATMPPNTDPESMYKRLAVSPSMRHAFTYLAIDSRRPRNLGG